MHQIHVACLIETSGSTGDGIHSIQMALPLSEPIPSPGVSISGLMTPEPHLLDDDSLAGLLLGDWLVGGPGDGRQQSSAIMPQAMP